MRKIKLRRQPWLLNNPIFWLIAFAIIRVTSHVFVADNNYYLDALEGMKLILALPNDNQVLRDVSYFKGDFLVQQGNYSDARSIYLHEVGPANRELLIDYKVGLTYLEDGQLEMAKTYWEGKKFPATILEKQAYANFVVHDYARSVEFQEVAMMLKPKDVGSKCRYYRYLEQQNINDDMLRSGVADVTLDIKAKILYPNTCLYRVGLWAARLREMDTALFLWQPLFEISTNNSDELQGVTYGQMAYIHYRASDYLIAQENPIEAIEHLRDVLNWGEGLDIWYVKGAEDRLFDYEKLELSQ